ncbi:MAG: flavodoxin family protein [Candidatus Bathyarchaeia archaeon]|jgi:flavodoxin
MKPIVVYASKSGNTKKIADSMAAKLGCQAIKITPQSNPSTVPLEAYDVVFLGTGLYAGTPNEDLVKYLKTLNLQSPKLFALFITWGGAPRSDKVALSKLRAILEGKGQKVLPEHFASYGGWKGVLMKRGHPKTEEIQAAGEWASKVRGKLEKAS